MNCRRIQRRGVGRLDGKWIANVLVGATAMLLVLALACGSAIAADASEETMAIFQAVLDATRAIQHPLTGRGTALVEVNQPSIIMAPAPGGRGLAVNGRKDPYSRNVERSVIDFLFKGEFTRSTRSRVGQDGRARPETLWAVADKCAVTYSYGGSGVADVESYAPLVFHRRIGYDFNPATFLRQHSLPLAELMERLMKGPSTLSAQMDADDVLHLTAHHRSSLQRDYSIISVDPAKDYRLVAFLDVGERFDKPEMNWTRFTEVQWGKYGSTWYVKAASQALYAGAHSWADKATLPVSDLKTSTVATITAFQPNVEIDDSEFTLNGLELPAGTRVYDHITGILYRIGAGALETDILEAPLARARFAQKIGAELRERDEHPIDEGTNGDAKRQISHAKTTNSGVSPAMTARRAGPAVLIALVAVAGAIVVLTTSRAEHRRFRKVRDEE